MNADHRRPLPGTSLDYFDARAAVEAIQPGAYDALPYVSRVLAENLVRRCDPAILGDLGIDAAVDVAVEGLERGHDVQVALAGGGIDVGGEAADDVVAQLHRGAADAERGAGFEAIFGPGAPAFDPDVRPKTHGIERAADSADS